MLLYGYLCKNTKKNYSPDLLYQDALKKHILIGCITCIFIGNAIPSCLSILEEMSKRYDE